MFTLNNDIKRLLILKIEFSKQPSTTILINPVSILVNMILGKITGRTSTLNFAFEVSGNPKKFDYIQIIHEDNYILCQIVELEREKSTIAFCHVIGYREDKILKQLLTPPEPGTEVLKAEDSFIKETLGLKDDKSSAYLGTLKGYDELKVYLDLNKLLTKHCCVLAKSGSGKSYATGCLIEEILEREIPLLIIDPHAEYSTLKQANDKDKESLLKFGIAPKAYRNINEYSPDPEINKSSRQLKLNSNNISSSELIHLLPARLSNAQLGLLYSALKSSDNKADFDRLIYELEAEENPGKYTIINIIEYLKKLDLFSEFPTSLQELIQPGKCSIITLKGIDPELQEVVVYKLMKDLFDARKRNNIPPFFAIIEEAHNYLPERNFGEAKSSAILRQISSEGRKFGLGLCIISQRPSRVDKSCISQATTQIILKITNPNDLKSISNSVESITAETEKEIKNLPIGTALVTGVVDMPLFVNVRPRRTKHGGEAVNILESVIPKTFSQPDTQEIKSEEEKGELLNIIRQRNTEKDLELMSQEKISSISTTLVPCLFISIKDNNLLVNLNTGELINNQETGSGVQFLKKLDLSTNQRKVFDTALTLKQFTAAELFAKSNVQFSEIYETINALLNKGYLQKEGSKLKLADSFSLNLEDFSFPDYPDYARIEYEKKLEKKFPAEEILKFLKTIAEIKNSKECWLAIYQVEYNGATS